MRELAGELKDGRATPQVVPVAATGDPGYSMDKRIGAMKVPVVLCHVRLTRRDEPREFLENLFDLGFFALVEGEYRCVGDLRSVGY